MRQGTVVSIGTFDGVHLGHQAILRELRHQADAHSLASLVYAFSVPPRWALKGGDERYLLLPIDQKLDLLGQAADRIYPATFESVRSMDPEVFIEEVLINQLQARVIVEGESFRFGRDRSGDLDTLRSLGSQKGIDVVCVPPVIVGDTASSSTRIREAVSSGDFQTARACLGRAPILRGSVVPGDQLGGELGYPTANLDVDPHILLPQPGIFLVHALGKQLYANGLLYIGSRPTLGQSEPRCEVHLLDFTARPLYGEVLEIHLLERLRGDRAFPSLDALRTQIGIDVAAARKRLADYDLTEKRIGS